MMNLNRKKTYLSIEGKLEPKLQNSLGTFSFEETASDFNNVVQTLQYDRVSVTWGVPLFVYSPAESLICFEIDCI